MPILSGVSGNALAGFLSISFGLGVWNQPLANVHGPVTVAIAAEGGTMTLAREGGTCFGKTTACVTRSLLLDATDAELAADAEGTHLVVEGGVARFVDEDAHFAGGEHVGDADVHCASAGSSSLFDMIDHEARVWSDVAQVQFSGDGGLDGLSARMERTGSSAAAQDADVACAAFDAEGGVTYAVGAFRNLDRLGDNPRGITGAVYNNHLEIDLD